VVEESSDVLRRDRNCSDRRRSAAATSTGVGTECVLLWVVGRVDVSIWES